MDRRSAAWLLAIILSTAGLISFPQRAEAAPNCYLGRPTIIGTSGIDRLVGTPGRDVIVGLGGRDTISGRGGSDLICGGSGNDRIAGAGNHDRLSGGPGRDRVKGGTGNDLFGSANLGTKETGSDELAGGPGVDQFWAHGGADVVRGGPGDDLISSGQGNDTLRGSEDDDHMIPGPGNDIVDGGDGVDSLGFDRGLPGIQLDLLFGSAIGEGSDQVANIEQASATDGDDVLRGNESDNVLTPLLGDDVVDGGSGRDRVEFNRTLPEQLPSGLDVDLAAGTASGEGVDTLTDIEDVTGSWLGDVIRGDEGPNRLEGYYGADTLEGRDGDDFLAGMVFGADSEIDLEDSGDGGPHVVGDTCDRVEHPTNCEFLE